MSLFYTVVLAILAVYCLFSYVILSVTIINRYNKNQLDLADMVIYLFGPIVLLLMVGLYLAEDDID